MLAEIMQAPSQPLQDLKGLLPAIALVCAIVSYMRRKEEIGGWLLYFYFWIWAVFLSYVTNILGHYSVYLPSSKIAPEQRMALIVAVIPRLLVFAAVIGIATVLFRRREWLWVQRLRLVIGAAVVISAVSLVVDVRYFPATLLVNGSRFAGLCVWFLYVCFSKRIRRVFQTKDWLSHVAKNPLLLGQPGNS
jgi:hypothetical protein